MRYSDGSHKCRVSHRCMSFDRSVHDISSCKVSVAVVFVKSILKALGLLLGTFPKSVT